MAGENVGVYGINQGDLALNSGNYDLSYHTLPGLGLGADGELGGAARNTPPGPGLGAGGKLGW